MNGTRSFRVLSLAVMLCLAATAGRAVVTGDASASIQTNELLALQDMNAVIEAEWAYHADHGVFVRDFAALTPPAGNYLSGDWSAARNGYLFSLSSGPFYQMFWVFADPAVPGGTGNRYFGADESGVILFNLTGGVSCIDLPAPEGHLPMADAQSPVNQARDYLYSIHRAQELFARRHSFYESDIDHLTTTSPPALFGMAQEFGYTFDFSGTCCLRNPEDCGRYQVSAAPDPLLPDSVCFFLDQTGVIRERVGAAATVLDPPTAVPCLAHPSRVGRLFERAVENEELARQDLTAVVYAQWAYYNAHGYFADSFTELLNAVPPLLTGDNWNGSRNGYDFVLGGGMSMYFTVNASPTTQDVTGISGFFADESGVIRVDYYCGSASSASDRLPQGRLPESSAYDPLAQAKDALCSLMRAQELFFGAFQYYASEFSLLTSVPPSFLKGNFDGVISGYTFVLGSIAPSQYSVNMDPACYTGSEPSFYADQSGLVTVRYDGGHATAADTPITLDCMEHPSRTNWVREIPTPTVNQAAGQADPAPTPGSATPVLFTVAFNVPVTGFDAKDVTWSGTATGISASVSGSGAAYTLRVTAGSAGTLVPSIAAGRCVGATGISNMASTSTDNSVTLNTGTPTGAIVINGNQAVTDNPNVTLALTWSDGAGSGVARMRFSNDGSTWSAWEAVAPTRAYTLPAGDGYKTVRVQYMDRLQNRSAVFSDYIRLDTAPATGGILINNNAPTTATQAVTLTLTWPDAGPGMVRMRFSDNGATWTAWEPLQATRAYTLPAGDGYKTVRVQYLDMLQNRSAVFSDYIRLLAGS